VDFSPLRTLVAHVISLEASPLARNGPTRPPARACLPDGRARVCVPGEALGEEEVFVAR